MIDEIPEKFRPYFNNAPWARDAEEKGEIWLMELYRNEITVFWNRHN